MTDYDEMLERLRGREGFSLDVGGHHFDLPPLTGLPLPLQVRITEANDPRSLMDVIDEIFGADAVKLRDLPADVFLHERCKVCSLPLTVCSCPEGPTAYDATDSDRWGGILADYFRKYGTSPGESAASSGSSGSTRGPSKPTSPGTTARPSKKSAPKR